jgi:hypothetical protein
MRYVVKSYARSRGNSGWDYGVNVIANGVIKTIAKLPCPEECLDAAVSMDGVASVVVTTLITLFPDAHVESQYINN